MNPFIIRKMKKDEIKIAIQWAQEEGWNPGLNDASCFYHADPEGFFIGLLGDEPIAVGSAVNYNEFFAFCGLYIVKKEYRGQGYGLQLTHERLKYVSSRITGIDGVVNNVSIYERLGYVPSHRQIRYEGKGPFFYPLSEYIVDLRTLPFNLIIEFDQKYFPAPRINFLRAWFFQDKSYALGYFKHQHLGGYGVIRKCFHGYKIGPLFAESPKIAQALFEALCAKICEGPVFLDIPEPNKNAQSLVKHYHMTPRFDVMRMYRNGIPKIHLAEGIYGVTTFEIG